MEQSAAQIRKGILIYLLITFALSSIFYFLIIRAGKMTAAATYGLMWCPGVSGLISCWILKYKLSAMGWRWGKWKYQAGSYLVPLLYALVAYLIIWATGWGGFYSKEFITGMGKLLRCQSLPDWAIIAIALVFIGTVGMIISVLSALGEEIGWRGFFNPAALPDK